jgi:hypothetical protein
MLLSLTASRVAASEHHGQVFFNGVPVPGATVTVMQGEKQLSTITDAQGVYEFAEIDDGEWKTAIEMRGFARLDNTVTVGANSPQGTWNLKLLPLETLLAEADSSKPEAAAQAVTKPIPSPSPSHTDRTAAAKGAAAKSEEPKAASPAEALEPQDENAEKAADGFLINGSVNNAATSQYSLAPAFGNQRTGAKGLYNGGIGTIIGNSVFDAKPYSLTGLETPKDAYNRVTVMASLGGPLIIPHLLYHGPNFFVAYQGTRNSDAATESGLVPDAAERAGELASGTIPVNPQAAALLSLYPQPNVAGNSGYNFQTEVLNETHTDALQSRLNKTIGRRDQLYGGFGFRSTRAGSENLFGFLDTTDTLGIDTNVNWSHSFRFPVRALVGYRFTSLRTTVRPAFEDRSNVSGDAGIGGNDQDQADWGPPGLVFSSGIAALADAQSAFNRNRTDAASLSLSTPHRRHTFASGGDFRSQEFNEQTEQNPRGVFTFNGAATGSDIGDFLSGIPDTSTLAWGNARKYFRQSVYDAFVSDDWRLRPELTINAGLRWDYGAPMTELFCNLANLDIAPGFTAAEPVTASSPTGPLTGTKYPGSLLRPDRLGFEPRIGIAWRPLPASTLVVRAGYGIYDDTSVYLSAAENMAQQAPPSTIVSDANSSACALTLANGFPGNCPGSIADTFASDPNLRVGYAQDWQLSIQSDLPKAMVIVATYSGIKGTRGMQEVLPNSYPIGATNPCPSCPVGFVYRTSSGNSTREAGELQLRRRLRNGFTATLDYTYAKAIDDEAQVGGQGHVAVSSTTSTSASSSTTAVPAIAQNWLDPRAERGLSTFDQRHLLKAQIQYTTGMGIGGGTLLSGWWGRLLKEWTVMSQINAGSGLPETPVLIVATPGTAVVGAIRPDLTGTQIGSSVSAGHFLNAAAYRAPASGQWGTARRDSITGPGQFSLDGALSRSFRLREPWNLDLRVDATNLLNHPVYTSWNTTLNWNTGVSSPALSSTTFGLPTAANSMRSLQVTGRLRF